MLSAFSTPAGKDSKNADTPCLRIMERRTPPLPPECRTVWDSMQMEMPERVHNNTGGIPPPPSHTFQNLPNSGRGVTPPPVASPTSVPPHQVRFTLFACVLSEMCDVDEY